MSVRHRGGDVLLRHENNPIMVIEDVPFRSAAIWNAAVTSLGGRYLMLVTIEELEGVYRIYKALSDDGLHFSFADTRPAFFGCDGQAGGRYAERGIRDARITRVDDSYWISYQAESRHGHMTGLVSTGDFRHYEHFPYTSQVDVKNGPLFPRRIGGRYCLIKRPQPGASLWLSFSDDMSFWGGDRCFMRPRGGYWDSGRIGAAGPPIEIDGGWLLVYYGVKLTVAGPLVRLGAAVLDGAEPWKIRARSDIPILSPRRLYERLGDVPNVVFSCGAVVEEGLIHVYYGASDSCLCRASAPVSDVVEVCFNGGGGGE